MKSKKGCSGIYSLVYISMIAVAMLGIIISIILTLLLASGKLNESAYVNAVESTLLTTGLSIIGTAIAVWAGLNIINAIKRNEIDEARADIEKLKENSCKMMEAWVPRNKQMFLTILESYPSNEHISKYFLEKFTVKSPSEDIVFDFMNIERIFSEVYNRHNSVNRNVNKLLNLAEQGIKIIESLNEENLTETECLYIKTRLSDFKFYMGYVEKNPEKYCMCFWESAKIAIEKAPYFGVYIPEFGTDLPNGVDEYNQHLDLTIYILNAIGEAYSKITENYEKLCADLEVTSKVDLCDCAQKAIFYSEYSLKIIDLTDKYNKKPGNNRLEVYYRNTGCAYERFDKAFGTFGDNAEKIIGCYREAFKTMRIDEKISRICKVYHTLLSYYKKYFDNKYKINQINNESDLNIYLKTLISIDNKDFEWLKDFCEVSFFGKHHLDKYNLPYVMNGFAYVFIILFKLSDNESVNRYYPESCELYLREVYENIYTLQLIGADNDDYCRNLIWRYKKIEAYLKNGGNQE